MRQSDWNAIQSAPREISLELSVIDEQGIHALIFPCRRSGNAWVNALTGARVDVRPTHWRLWQKEERS